MKRSRYNRRKRIIIAYVLRTGVCLVLAGMFTLMICGCIYLFDFFRQAEGVNASDTYGPVINMEMRGMETNNAGASGTGINNAETNPDGLGEGNEPENDENYTGFRIVLDAGHGGEDGGTYSGESIEKDITLSVVLHMKELLEENGVEVVLTREEDKSLSLEDRVSAADRSDADLFVSIHCNYYEDDAAVHGLECYYYDGSGCGQYYAETIIDCLEENDKITVRNAKAGDYYVLRETEIPAVLIEIGFLSNRSEARKLISEEYQESISSELVESILKSMSGKK